MPVSTAFVRRLQFAVAELTEVKGVVVAATGGRSTSLVGSGVFECGMESVHRVYAKPGRKQASVAAGWERREASE
jgi:hypothetical protein